MEIEKSYYDPSSEFDFVVNADLVKANGQVIVKEDDLDYDNMWVQGVASDTNGDLEGETLNPNKFILDYFMKVGKITYEHQHKEKPLSAIGEPREAKINSKNQFFVKGILYSKNDLAKDVYKQTYILQSDPNSTRRMQWSVEGKRMWKDGKVIGAIITHVTLTQNPINYKGTYAEVVKKALQNDIIIKNEQSNNKISPERESELMVWLFDKDKLIYNDIHKAEKFIEILDYCYKNYPIEAGTYFETNTINKLDTIIDNDNDIKKSINKCDIIFYLLNKAPDAKKMFETNFKKSLNNIYQRIDFQ